MGSPGPALGYYIFPLLVKCGQVDARPPLTTLPISTSLRKTSSLPPSPPLVGFRPSDFDRLGPSVPVVRRRPFLALLLPFCRDDVGISPAVVVEMPLVRFDQSGHFVFEVVGVKLRSLRPFLSVSFFGHEGILFALWRHRCARFPRRFGRDSWSKRKREGGKGRAFQRSLSPHEHSARSS